MTFRKLGIIEPILEALKAEGYTQPTPIQEQAIPILLRGKDLLGCAQTGTGKTAAFAIPILQYLYSERQRNNTPRRIRALIVTPTRELAIQISESFTAYGRFTGIKNTVVFGGVKQDPQTQALGQGVDVLVATPGRLLDLMDQGYISLSDIGYFVLDEADRMLDMGFIHDIRKIIAKLPVRRQSLFFSATMPPDIVELSRKILGNPEKVSVKPEQTTAEKVEQSVYFVSKQSKPKLLAHLIGMDPDASVLVFSRTKHGADKIVKSLKKEGIDASVIHGNKSQGARQQALGGFKNGDTNVLVATDIAARGIDIEELHLVVNYDLPNIPETYVHRIGRTGRAGAGGLAVSFCDEEEKEYLRDIQKLIHRTITVVPDHPFVNDNDGDMPEIPVKLLEPVRQTRRESPGSVKSAVSTSLNIQLPDPEQRIRRAGQRSGNGVPRLQKLPQTFQGSGDSFTHRQQLLLPVTQNPRHKKWSPASSAPGFSGKPGAKGAQNNQDRQNTQDKQDNSARIIHLRRN